MIPIEYKNQVSWITGATGEIGKSICYLLAKGGSNLVISDLDQQEINNLKKQLEKLKRGIKILTAPLDVSDADMVRDVGDDIYRTFNRLDNLVNVAGISPKGPNGRVSADKVSLSEWNKVLDINLTGTLLCSQEAIKIMKENESGHIVNISSQAARSYSSITGIHYAVSKAGIIALTRQLAGEFGPNGIFVNAVAPGRIDTPMIHDVAEEVNKEVINNIPLRRLGTTEEVANTILFLLSNKSSYITGSVIDINGGRLMV